VVQVKKKQIRQAIVDSAYDLFSARAITAPRSRTSRSFPASVSAASIPISVQVHLLYAVSNRGTSEFEQLQKRVLR